METTSNPQFGLLDTFMPAMPTNDFLERLERTLDFKPIEKALHAMYPGKWGRPPCPPLVLFKMSLLQHCYGLSDPQCEELVKDRLSWRRFAGLGLQDKVPDETTLVRFRQRLVEHGLHEKLLTLVNRQLEQKGFILKTCTLVDATLLQAARRADNTTSGDEDAGYTVKKGQPHYGYKAHVAVDESHTLIRNVELTSANVHDCREFEALVKGDEEMVMADKAYWSKERSRWCERRNIGNGILRKAFRGQPLDKTTLLFNRLMSRVRCGIEKVFGWWKRSALYRRVRYVGREPNRLELEFKSICWNLKRLVTLTGA
ncbi:MAG: IS5 family transposase [Patescibacteria group bacterium]|nr:IS5 family transposase [Patescibacteria group bacterium]